MCACGLEPLAKGPPPAPSPDIVLRGVTMRNYRDSSLHLTATMPRLELMRESTDLQALDVNAHLATGTVVSAKTVGGNANEGRIVGSNGVRFRSPDNVVGTAPAATYEKAVGPQGSAHGEVGVQLDHPQFSLQAQAFTIDFATQKADFTKAVTKTKGRDP